MPRHLHAADEIAVLAQRIEQLELIGGKLEHVEALGAERREIECAATDIAADLAAPAGMRQAPRSGPYFPVSSTSTSSC